MLGSLPHDCHLNTGSGFSFRKANPDGSATYAHAYCNMMTCRSCAKKRCITAAHAIRDAISVHRMLTHVTLTLPPLTKDHEQGRVLARALRRLLLNIADHCKHPFTYVWAYGSGKGGRLHLHLITNVVQVPGTIAIPTPSTVAATVAATGSAAAGATPATSTVNAYGVCKTWVKMRWFKLTGAKQVRVTSFPPSDASQMSRYLMKNVLETVFAGHKIKRRFGSSRDIQLVNKRGPGTNAGADANANTSNKWERISGPSSRHGRRLRIWGVDNYLNPTFIAPANVNVPPCLGTGADGTRAQGGIFQPETDNNNASVYSFALCTESPIGDQQ